MNTAAAIAVLEDFLVRSPRESMEVRVRLDNWEWCWRHGAALRTDSPVFEIGSVSKVFTATLLALLARRGQLSLDDTVAHFFPQLPWAGRVSLGQLASHTSGLPRDPCGWWRMWRRGPEFARSFRDDHLGTFLQSHAPKVRRAGRAGYSNVGMALLGRVLSKVCGLSYGDAVREWILRPLGMADTHLATDVYSEERLMVGHDSRGRPVAPFAWSGMEAAGGWRSTGADLTIFLRALAGQGGEWWAELAADTIRPRARISRDTEVGLGWMLSKQGPWGKVAWHAGGTFGQHSLVAWSPDGGAVVVLLTNRMPPWWHHVLPARQLEALPARLLHALRC
jgi:CubicO group peptidase (beta-lactamase class C family)